MVFKQNFVLAVKSNGKVLREQDGKVFLPVGTEYSILMKNLSSQKVLVSVTIDGQDVLNGRKLIIMPNSNLELERYLEDDLQKGRKFKFIEKTEQISKHRGDRIDDGLIRVEYKFEKVYRPVYNPYTWETTWLGPPQINWHYYSDNVTAVKKTYDYKSTAVPHTYDEGALRLGNIQVNTTVSYSNEVDGITVKGSESNQAFDYGYIGELESGPPYVITLQLRGIKPSGDKVQKPITVQDKIICKTCGKSNSSSNKYCGECGAYLY